MNSVSRCSCFLILFFSGALIAQQPSPHSTTASEAPTRDTSYIDAQGTAHVTRIVPVPETISTEAQQMLSHPEPDQGPPVTLAMRRSRMNVSATRDAAAWSKLCPTHIVEDKISGVPVRIVTPEGYGETNRDKILMNLHGGGFNADSGSYAESIPIASYTHIKVVAVLYRLAAEHPFPAAVNDSVSVYKELLKTYKPDHIVIYGTSAGAVLTAEVAAKLTQLCLPLPAALGIISGMGDLSRNGDSISVFGGRGFTGHLDPPPRGLRDHEYVGNADPRDPVLSPIFSDLHGLPSSLLISSERDMLLSGTGNLHRALLKAGVDARLVVFDALPHAFWYNAQLPETIEANHIMADFMVSHLAK